MTSVCMHRHDLKLAFIFWDAVIRSEVGSRFTIPSPTDPILETLRGKQVAPPAVAASPTGTVSPPRNPLSRALGTLHA